MARKKIKEPEETEVIYGEFARSKGDFGAMFDALSEEDYNPDRISFDTYFKMTDEDAQVGAASTLLQLAVMAKGWSVAFSDEFKHKMKDEIITFITKCFSDLTEDATTYTFEDFLKQFLLTPLLGFGVAEPVYYYNTTEKKIMLRKLKVLPHDSIKFRTDDYGNLRRIYQEFTTGGVRHNLKRISKYLVWVFDMREANFYGNPMLKRAYKHWYIKEFLLKMWDLYLERKATPIPVGKTQPSRMKRMKEYLSKLNAKSSLVIHTDDEIETLDMGKAGDFERAIRYHDMMIFRALMTPTLLLGQEDVGARSLGDTHMLVFNWVVRASKTALINHMGKVIKALVVWNYGEMEEYPQLVIPDLNEVEMGKFADVIYKLVMAQVIEPDEEWIRKRIGAPPRQRAFNPESAGSGHLGGGSSGGSGGSDEGEPGENPPGSGTGSNRNSNKDDKDFFF